jgi:hypothetical protein
MIWEKERRPTSHPRPANATHRGSDFFGFLERWVWTEGLGLAGRISPATRHLVAGHRDPWLGLTGRGLVFFFFFPSGSGEFDFFFKFFFL